MQADTPSSPDDLPPGPSTSTTAELDASVARQALHLRPLSWGAPLRWIKLGFKDFIRAPGIGLFYGACFMVMGWALLKVFEAAPAYTLALSAGFLLMGPFMCLGLYHVSKQLEQGLTPDFGQSLMAWDTRTGTLAIFGFVLLVLEMIWGRASLIVFAVSFDGMPDFKGSLLALLNPENINFIIAYVVVGAFFAGLIFAVTVISIPMILDRPTDAITAGLTSFKLVLTQPGVMLWWGCILTVLVVAALLPWFAGLLIVGPITGHATWHAYREAVSYTED
ncbi:MAG: DUF2189 domain-containing protein [Ideonella sp.]|nr:DUF2189 domain-containing protein [Ideonella sp.]